MSRFTMRLRTVQVFDHPWTPPPSTTQDAREIDRHPDRCWRCDDAWATRDVGLCAPCHADLRGERA